MSTHPSPASAAARPTFRSGAGRRRPHDSIAVLQRCSDRLDQLLRDVQIGARSQREHDAHVAAAEEIAGRLRAAFREPTPARLVNPPLADDGRGRCAW